MEEYKIYYSSSSTSWNGAGVILDEIMQTHMIEGTKTLDWLMSVELCWEEITIHIVSWYTPQFRRDQKVKLFLMSFCALLETYHPSNEKVIIGADLNAHVGMEKAGYETVYKTLDYKLQGGNGSTDLSGLGDYKHTLSEEGETSHYLRPWRTNPKLISFLIRDYSWLIDQSISCNVIPRECTVRKHTLLLMYFRIQTPQKYQSAWAPDSPKWWQLK